MTGETWELYAPREEEFDDLGEPIKAYTKWTVANVLTKPSTVEDLGEERPNGVSIEFILALPKNRPEGMDVTSLRGGYAVPLDGNRDGGKYLIVGEPQITQPCPTSWNATVRIGRTDG